MTEPDSEPVQALQENLFHDEDLADFEEPSRRWRALARYQSMVPAAVVLARALMFCQPFIVVLAPVVLAATSSGAGPDETTPGAAPGPEVTDGGSAGGGLVALLGLALVVVVVPLLAARVGKLSASARLVAYAVEGLMLVLSLGTLLTAREVNFISTAAAGYAVTSAAVLGLLGSRSARKAFVESIGGENGERLDIRNL